MHPDQRLRVWSGASCGLRTYAGLGAAASNSASRFCVRSNAFTCCATCSRSASMSSDMLLLLMIGFSEHQRVHTLASPWNIRAELSQRISGWANWRRGLSHALLGTRCVDRSVRARFSRPHTQRGFIPKDLVGSPFRGVDLLSSARID